MNRRVLYNRASADPDGTPWSERKKLDADGKTWTGGDVPDFPAHHRPDYRPPEDAHAAEAIGVRDGQSPSTTRNGHLHWRAASDLGPFTSLTILDGRRHH